MADRKKNSWQREILEIIVAFAAAWLFYQGLSVVTGSAVPIVSVASQSMYHQEFVNFDRWWAERAEFYESDFMKFPVHNGLDKRDMLFVVKSDIAVGDIIVYNPSPGCFPVQHQIVHRVIKIENGNYITKGDANNVQDRCPVSLGQVEGKALFSVPLLGYPRLLLNQIFGI
jgi:hypothetical protein